MLYGEMNALTMECLRHPFEGTNMPKPLRSGTGRFRAWSAW
jgi:hypothetical protein